MTMTKANKSGVSKKKILLILTPFFIIFTLLYVPSIWVYTALFVDFYTPWVLFESPLYEAYHQFLVSRLPERDESPIPEMRAEDATYESVRALSKGYTFPVVIKGMLKDSAAVKNFRDDQWWVDNYADAPLLCGTQRNVIENCTIGKFYKSLAEGNPFYVSGSSEIIKNHPEIFEMMDNQAVRDIAPAKYIATQIFAGVPPTGTDVHCAIAVNIFRQLVGRKKWWFIPPSQTVYLKPSININAFSVHTRTKIGKDGEEASPWLNKLERYTAILDPGDVLINPSWFWHAILNQGTTNDDLTIAAASRYGGNDPLKPTENTLAALRTNLPFSVNLLANVLVRFGVRNPGKDLEAHIANDRRMREKKRLMELQEAHRIAEEGKKKVEEAKSKKMQDISKAPEVQKEGEL